MNLTLQKNFNRIFDIVNQKIKNANKQEKRFFDEPIYKIAIFFCAKLHPDILDLIDTIYQLKIGRLQSEFNIQFTKEEKLKVLEEEIKNIQKILDQDYIKYGILPMLDKTFTNFWKETQKTFKLIFLSQIEVDGKMEKIVNFLPKLEQYLASEDLMLEDFPLGLREEFDQIGVDEEIEKNTPALTLIKDALSIKNMKQFALRGHATIAYVYKLKNYFDVLTNQYHILNKLTIEEILDKNKPSKEQTITIPSNHVRINVELTDLQIKKFFSFLYLETGGTDAPFLPKEDVNELLKYGLSIPRESTGKYFHLNLEGQKKTKKMIYHAVNKLNELTINKHEKIKLAKFLKFYFDNFKERKLKAISNDIRSPSRRDKTINFSPYLPKE